MSPHSLKTTPPKYAPVLPVSLAREFKEVARSHFGDYHLLLAHDVLAHDQEYHDVYHDIRGIKIMDNSTVELGRPVSTYDIMRAAEITGANVVVLPDVLHDREETVRKTVSTYREWMEKLPNEIQMMAIPQGKTVNDWIRCVEEIVEQCHLLEWIGVPRNFRRTLHESRSKAVEIVRMLKPQAKLHLFGFSGDLVDDMLTAIKYPEIEGIDSAMPIRLGTQGKKLSLTSYTEPRGTWWQYPGKLTDEVIGNVYYIQRLLGYYD